jgi:tetratricopeptide (TPR) repeat protein
VSKFPVRSFAILVAFAVATGCSKDPGVAAAEYIKSGDRYFDQKKYSEAALQYRNAVQQDPKSGDAHLKLAKTFEATGDLDGAGREFIRAGDAMPANIEAQTRAAQYLLLSRHYEDARTRANKALAIDADNVEARIILGNALANLEDLDSALRELEGAIKLAPSSLSGYTSLGAIQLARGNHAEAEAAFRKAVETNPKSLAAHLALANFLWSSNRPQDAEGAFKQALVLDPHNLLAQRALAGFYIGRGRAPEAEPYLKATADADTSPSAPQKFALADYYVTQNRPDDALKVLEPLAGTKETSAAAQTRIASIKYSKRDGVEAQKIISDVLKRDPKNVAALLVNADILNGQGKTDEAIGQLRFATAANPGSDRAHFRLGQLLRAKGLTDEAMAEFNEVLKINPAATPAQIELSELNLTKGSRAPALQLAQDASKAAPNNPIVQMNLARAFVANNDFTHADPMVARLLSQYTNAPAVHALAGSVALAKKDANTARREFSRAAELDPKNFEALSGLVLLDFAARKPADAKARVEERLKTSPQDARVLALAARVNASMGDLSTAEQQLRQAIENDPNYLAAYGMLAGLYISQKRLPDARANLEAVVAKRPAAVGPLTLVGMLWEAEGNTAEAVKRYQKALAIDPRAGVAANNLAFRYAQDGGNLDVALQLAQTAKERLPNAPEIDDTLGWVYYKKNLASMAVPLFEQAVRKQPDNAEFQYHLGVSAVKAGEVTKGRKALEQASQGQNPVIAAEAKKALAEL